MAEIMEREARATRDTWSEQAPIAPGAFVYVASRGIGVVEGLHPDGCYAVRFGHLDELQHCVPRAVFPVPPEARGEASAWSLNWGRA